MRKSSFPRVEQWDNQSKGIVQVLKIDEIFLSSEFLEQGDSFLKLTGPKIKVLLPLRRNWEEKGCGILPLKGAHPSIPSSSVVLCSETKEAISFSSWFPCCRLDCLPTLMMEEDTDLREGSTEQQPRDKQEFRLAFLFSESYPPYPFMHVTRWKVKKKAMMVFIRATLQPV